MDLNEIGGSESDIPMTILAQVLKTMNAELVTMLTKTRASVTV